MYLVLVVPPPLHVDGRKGMTPWHIRLETGTISHYSNVDVSCFQHLYFVLNMFFVLSSCIVYRCTCLCFAFIPRDTENILVY